MNGIGETRQRRIGTCTLNSRSVSRWVWAHLYHSVYVIISFDQFAPFADMMYQDPATEVDGAVRCSEATTLRSLWATGATGQFLWMDTGSLADHGRGSAALSGSGCIRGEYKDIRSCSSPLLMFSLTRARVHLVSLVLQVRDSIPASHFRLRCYNYLAAPLQIHRQFRCSRLGRY